LVLSTKRLIAAAKFLAAATKNLFVVPNFVAVTKPFFSVYRNRALSFLDRSEDRFGTVQEGLNAVSRVPLMD